jgi:hypothetical protein
MMRQTRAHHVQLSLMADRKANMMMTVASLLVPLSLRYIQSPEFQSAAVVMIVFCILTVILAAYAAMPKLSRSEKTSMETDVNDPSFNLLFFGAFSKMSYPEFETAMEDVMNDPNRTYEAQVREVYIMGRYLERKKYRFVRLAYMSFIAGAVGSSGVYVFVNYIR